MSLPAVIAAPIVIFLFNYIAFSQTIPHLLTMAVGQNSMVTLEAFRDTGGGRYFCAHSVAIHGANDSLMELCVTGSTWDQLPGDNFTAEFEIQNSWLGVSFKNFRSSDNDAGSDFAVINRWL